MSLVRADDGGKIDSLIHTYCQEFHFAISFPISYTQQAIQWDQITILGQARRHKELRIKEALHILMTPFDQLLNLGEGLELPSWILDSNNKA